MAGKVEIPHDLVGQSGLYNSPDPLLRRLRLQDTVGNDILDLEKYFQKKEILVLYAGSEHGLNNLKAFHRDLFAFSVKQMKTCAVIYVSTDTDPESPARVLSGQAWLRMVFEDNSDFAPMAPYSEGKDGAAKRRVHEAAVEDVKRGEDFVQAGEVELGVEKISFGTDESLYDYVRPFSRAAITATMNAFSTPSVAVYHLPSHRFLSKNVSLKNFASDRIDKNYDTWRNGGTPRVRLMDVVHKMRFSLILLALAVLYQLFALYGTDLIGEGSRRLEGWRAEWHRRSQIQLP